MKPVYYINFSVIVVCGILYQLSAKPALSSSERQHLTQRFEFDRFQIAKPTDKAIKTVMEVNPHLAHIAPWMSSVGAGIALFDLEGEGVEDDLCVTDPSSQTVFLQHTSRGTPNYSTEILLESGTHYNEASLPTGCRAGDFNEDGRADLLVTFFGRPPYLLIQKTSETSANESRFYLQDVVPPDENHWYTATATLADLDGDGHIDFVLGNYFQDNSDIYDATSERKPELHRSLSNARNGGKNRFFLWRSSTSSSAEFVEVDTNLPEDEINQWTLGIGSADLNHDGLGDLYIANDFGPDAIYINTSKPGNLTFKRVDGNRGFTTLKSKALGHDSFKGMSIDFADINRDGQYDMFVSNIAAEWKLEESHFFWMSTGDQTSWENNVAPYTEESFSLGVSESGWGWDTKLADFDNDGQLEAIQATGFIRGKINRWPEMHQWATGLDNFIEDPSVWPYMIDGDINGYDTNPFYVMDKKGRFRDIAQDIGVAGPWVSRGFAVGDIDGDGDLDFAVANQWDNHYLFVNNSSPHNKSLSLQLLLPRDPNTKFKTSKGHTAANDAVIAIGSEVTITMADGSKRKSFVDGGNGHSGARGKFLHFGLGDNQQTPVKAEITWRGFNGQLNRWSGKLESGKHTILLGRG